MSFFFSQPFKSAQLFLVYLTFRQIWLDFNLWIMVDLAISQMSHVPFSYVMEGTPLNKLCIYWRYILKIYLCVKRLWKNNKLGEFSFTHFSTGTTEIDFKLSAVFVTFWLFLLDWSIDQVCNNLILCETFGFLTLEGKKEPRWVRLANKVHCSINNVLQSSINKASVKSMYKDKKPCYYNLT